MSILLWLVIGALVGAVAGMIMGESMGLFGNIVIGVVGAFLGGMLFSRGDINNSPLSIGTFSVSLVGAIVLLGIVNLFRRASLR